LVAVLAVLLELLLATKSVAVMERLLAEPWAAQQV